MTTEQAAQIIELLQAQKIQLAWEYELIKQIYAFFVGLVLFKEAYESWCHSELMGIPRK